LTRPMLLPQSPPDQLTAQPNAKPLPPSPSRLLRRQFPHQPKRKAPILTPFSTYPYPHRQRRQNGSPPWKEQQQHLYHPWHTHRAPRVPPFARQCISRNQPASLSLLLSQWTNPLAFPWRLCSMLVMKQAPSCAATPPGAPIVWKRMPPSSIRPPAHRSRPTASLPQGSSASNTRKPCFQRWKTDNLFPGQSVHLLGKGSGSGNSHQIKTRPPMSFPSRFLVPKQRTSLALIVFLLRRFPGVQRRPLGGSPVSCLIFAIHRGIS